jgi:citrate lyase subunit beta/citryl-CoA lyase
MIAKTAHEDDVAAVRAVWPDVPVIALIESIGGIERLAQIAAAANVDALAFGAYDLCAELGARPTSQVLIPWRSRIVFAARSAGRRAIDTPFLALDDPAGLAADAQTAVDFGFDGKLAVHPAQVAAIRSAFVPLPDEVARARRIVGAFSNGGVGVADGVMIDRPVLLAALRVLERTTAES